MDDPSRLLTDAFSLQVILAHDAEPGVGGQGAHLLGVVRALQQDFKLELFCREAPAGFAAHVHHVRRSRVASALEPIPLVRRFRDWHSLVSQSHFDRLVARSLRRADVFYGVGGQCLGSLLKAKAMGALTVLDVLTAHIDQFAAADAVACAEFGMRPSTNRILRRRMRREYQVADVVRVESEFARRTFIDRGFDPSRVVALRPPLVDAPLFPAHEHYDGPFQVLFVGLFHPGKGFQQTVRAFERAAVPGAQLQLWGGPPTRPTRLWLERLVRQNPSISVRSDDLRKVGFGLAYGKASVLVHLSLSDGWAYVVSEAMASGVPVIVSEHTGACEIVRDGQNGYVVPVGDVALAAERLRHLAADRLLLQRLGENARATAQSLTEATFRKDLNDMLCTLVANSRLR